MQFGESELAQLFLRLIGAFYVFAGIVGGRAALMSAFMDHALAGISGKKTTAREWHLSLWLLCMTFLVFAGGVALMLLLQLSVWLFVVCAVMQGFYLVIAAPYYFDLDDPPDALGRQRTTNAFVIYAGVTVLLIWASDTYLVSLNQLHPIVLVIGASAVVGYAGYLIWRTRWLSRETPSSPDIGSQSETLTSVRVAADYYRHPLQSLDDNGFIAPDSLDLSDDLIHDFNLWAEEFETSYIGGDEPRILWSEAQHIAHAAKGRPLAERLKRERPDLRVYFRAHDGEEDVEILE